MKRHYIVGLLLASVAAGPIVAQAPNGWLVRADRSESASAPDAAGTITFTSTGIGFHAVNPRAAVFWNPANTASGIYSVKATFRLLKSSSQINYYGLAFGGSHLEGPTQRYLYFLVAEDGTWLIKLRDGDSATQDIAPKTANTAVKRPDATGKSVNALEVRVGAGKVDYLVNSTVVHSTPKSGLVGSTNGIYGIRVNHSLEVQIDGFGITRP